MKTQARIALWGLAVYICSWIIFFVVLNNSHARWSFYAYNAWVLAKFVFPSALVFFMIVASCLPRERGVRHRGLWLVWGLLTLPLIAYLSFDSWQLYIIQNDAPMGIIPDANAILCAILATSTYLCLRIAWWVARTLNKRFGQQGGGGYGSPAAGSPSPHR